MEQALIEKIKEIRSQVKDRLIARHLKEDDWDILVSWWNSWPGWENPARGFLPDNGKGGLMVEKNNKPIVAGFLYQTDSDAVLFEWVVSDPDYREDDRKDAIELLIKEAEETCRNWGYKHMFSIGRTRSLIETHRKMGWHVDDKPSHEITKNL
tara:strand:+ start:752 stop:1210 length:459 start_codon:yes stop_codon:yes gene_type:complete